MRSFLPPTHLPSAFTIPPIPCGTPVLISSIRSGGFVEIGIGRYRLRIEEIKTVVPQGMGGIVKADGKCVGGRNDRIDLGKGVDRFEPCYICWKWKRPHRLFMKHVL